MKIKMEELNKIQINFLKDIQEVGLNIIIGKITASEIQEIFYDYSDKIQSDKYTEYCNTVFHLSDQMKGGLLTPDYLLFSLGKYLLYFEDDIDDKYELVSDIIRNIMRDGMNG